MTRMMSILAALVVGLSGPAARADEVTLESVPPVVVKTIPAAGAGDVDPKLTEIRVTFSKDMEDGSWSWATLSDESFPKMDGKPKYLADKRTCVLPVKLEPGKTYAIWVNNEKFRNFKDADGRPGGPVPAGVQDEKVAGNRSQRLQAVRVGQLRTRYFSGGKQKDNRRGL